MIAPQKSMELKEGVLLSFATLPSTNGRSTGWIPVVFLSSYDRNPDLKKCISYRGDTPEIINIHVTRLDVRDLEYNYIRPNHERITMTKYLA